MSRYKYTIPINPTCLQNQHHNFIGRQARPLGLRDHCAKKPGFTNQNRCGMFKFLTDQNPEVRKCDPKNPDPSSDRGWG